MNIGYCQLGESTLNLFPTKTADFLKGKKLPKLALALMKECKVSGLQHNVDEDVFNSWLEIVQNKGKFAKLVELYLHINAYQRTHKISLQAPKTQSMWVILGDQNIPDNNYMDLGANLILNPSVQLQILNLLEKAPTTKSKLISLLQKGDDSLFAEPAEEHLPCQIILELEKQDPNLLDWVIENIIADSNEKQSNIRLASTVFCSANMLTDCYTNSTLTVEVIFLADSFKRPNEAKSLFLGKIPIAELLENDKAKEIYLRIKETAQQQPDLRAQIPYMIQGILLIVQNPKALNKYNKTNIIETKQVFEILHYAQRFIAITNDTKASTLLTRLTNADVPYSKILKGSPDVFIAYANSVRNIQSAARELISQHRNDEELMYGHPQPPSSNIIQGGIEEVLRDLGAQI